MASVAQSAYGAYETAKQQVIARQGIDVADPYGMRQLAIGGQMLRNAQQQAIDQTAGQPGATVSAGTGGFAVEAVASVLEMPSNAMAGLTNLALPGGAAMWQGREPSEAELAYAPARRQQVAGLKAALDPNLSIPERAAHGFAAVATTPVVIAEGLTWGAGGRASDAVGEQLYKAASAPTLTDAGFHTLEAGQQFLTAFTAFGSLAAPGSSKPGRGGNGWATEDFLQEVAVRAERKIGGTGAVAGTGKHAYAAELIERYQSRFGAVGEGLTTEQSYLGGRYLGRSMNLKGSVRLDVVEGAPATPSAIYDFKFTVNPNPTLSPGRIAQIRTQARLPSSVPVEVIHP